MDGQKFFNDASGEESAGVGDVPAGAVAAELLWSRRFLRIE